MFAGGFAAARRLDDFSAGLNGWQPQTRFERLLDMWTYYKETVSWLFRLDSQEWFLAMCAALLIGFFALRGFGSRSNY